MKPWRERLEHPDEKMVDDAEMWATCAVGEQRGLYPEVVIYSNPLTTIESSPLDFLLSELGHNFYHELSNQINTKTYDYSHAKDILDQIEDRVLQLKREKI